MPFPTYTEDDLNRHKSDDWTNEETDYMMDLCKTFDCRFIIGNTTFKALLLAVSLDGFIQLPIRLHEYSVHDRYDEKLHGKSRSVEDIKDRFYKLSAPSNR